MKKIPDITEVKPDYVADNLGVMRFAQAMQEKMKISRDKGRSGWNDPKQVSELKLQEMLLEHMAKGDVVDIANFCMFIWNRKNPKGIR